MPTEIPIPVLFTQKNRIGCITLDRPKVLNALNDTMITSLSDQLQQWAKDPSIEAVIIKGAGARGFCAGIDLRYIYELKPDKEKLSSVFQTEYNLNYDISRFPKPYIAMLHGYAIGGGLGISIHGSHRIVCAGTTLAMPEVTIGFFPDIGASYFLNKCPGYLGMYLALSGAYITAEDGLYAGLATHYFRHEDYEDFISLVATSPLQDLDAILLKFQQKTKASSFVQLQPLIDRIFCQDSFEDVMRALEQDKSEFSKSCLDGMSTKSPTSLKVTFEMMKRARGKSLREALDLDCMLARNFVKSHDFFEGIRALIVDKDQRPRWQPKTVDQVDDLLVRGYFLS